MADFGILAKQVSMQNQREQEKKALRAASSNQLNNQMMNNTLTVNNNPNGNNGYQNFNDVPTIIVQSSSIKSKRSMRHREVSQFIIFCCINF
jgi:hypothetical protein